MNCLGLLQVRVDVLCVCRSGVFRNSSSLCLNVARAAAQASVRHVPAPVQRKNVGTVRRAATAGV